MTDWREALLERFEQQGPIDLFVSVDEYRRLGEVVRRLWRRDSPTWAADPTTCRLFLAYLRGYTFYREVPENDTQFWPNFHEELGLEQPSNMKTRYDALWTVLHSDPRTRAHCHMSYGVERDRREFVQAIRDSWGYRTLGAPQLIALFARYFEIFPGKTVTPERLRNALGVIDEATLRQAATYDRLFRPLTGIVDHLLATDPTLVRLPYRALSEHLEQNGVLVGEPNVVAFLHHKSEHALRDLLGRLRPSLRHWVRLRQATRTVARAPGVQVRLADGYHPAGQAVVVRVTAPPAALDLEVELVPLGQRVPVRNGAAIFEDVPPGAYRAVTWSHGERGAEASVTVLPPLSWSLPTPRGPLIEGEWHVGRVQTEDGRFAPFRWHPHWEKRGERYVPATTRVALTLDEDLRVELDVTAASIGARLVDAEGGQVERVHDARDLEALRVCWLRPPHLPARSIRPRVLLESAPDAPVNPHPTLTALARQAPAGDDRIVLEVQVRREWRRVLAVDYAATIVLSDVCVAGNAVRVLGQAPRGSALTVHEAAHSGSVSRQYPWPGGGLLVAPLRLPDVAEPRTVTLTVEAPGCPVATRTVDYVPTLGSPWAWAVEGLGW
ncbi:hypothetical protein [Deinococcus budaensis]|uniref:hypothetical protein n=1 Tax=Deinococcus budaensis TaxID=1665626 RepID=UPI0035F480F5